MKLLIVESPNKCGKIRSYLGGDYKVTASVGHIREIPPDGMNIDIEGGFIPTFKISDSKKDVVAEIKKLAKEADEIYLASDADREGESIGSHIYEILDKTCQKKCHRITFTEITKKAILEALKHPRKIDQNLVDAQQARQVLDRLIGYTASPTLWKPIGRGSSAGRVQSIALKLICERQAEIDAFKPIDFWYVDAILHCKNGDFTAKVIADEKEKEVKANPDEPVQEEDKQSGRFRFLKEKVAKDTVEALKTAKYTLDRVERKEKLVKPYPPFDTTSLQTSAASALGWDATRTMKVAQALYEQGKCFLKGTLVPLSDGRISPIEQLCDKEVIGFVPSGNLNNHDLFFTPKTENLTPVKIDQYCGKIFNISTENTVLKVTEEHVFPVYDSTLGKIVDKQAKDLIAKTDFLVKDPSLKTRGIKPPKTILSLFYNDPKKLSKKIRLRFKRGFVKSIPGINQKIRETWGIFTMYKYKSIDMLPLDLIMDLIKDGVLTENDIENNYVSIGYNRGGSKYINLPFKFNEDFFYLLGLIISDGHLPKKSSKFSLEALLLKNPCKLDLSKFLNISDEINEFTNRLGINYSKNLSYSCAPIRDIISQIGGIPEGKKSHTVEIPDFVLQAGDDQVKAFIAGLWDGDGFFTLRKDAKQRIFLQAGYTSGSFKLIEKLRILLHQYGIYSFVHQDKRSKAYSIKIASNDVDKMASLISKNSIIKSVVYQHIKPQVDTSTCEYKRRGDNLPIIQTILHEMERAGYLKNDILNQLGIDLWNFSKKVSEGRNRNSRVPIVNVEKIAEFINSKILRDYCSLRFEEIESITTSDYTGEVYCFRSPTDYFQVEDGIITHNCSYIRTDSYNISEEALLEVRNFIQSEHGDKYLPSKPQTYEKKSSAASQEAHECIRPTHIEETGSSLTGDSRDLYELVRDRFIACQMNPMVLDTVVYHIKSSSKNKLISKGQALRFDGFSKVYKQRESKDEILPLAEEKENLDLKDLKCTKHTTKPPERYNDGTLVKKMEADGVGRPSTRAKIIKNLEDKNYVTKDRKAFEPTDIGKRICAFLTPAFHDNFMDIKYTAKLEEDLDLIADGKKGYLEVVKPAYESLKDKVKKIDPALLKSPVKATGKPCTVCNEGGIVERHGKFGLFFCCDKYPACKTAYILEDGEYKVKKAGDSKDTGEKCQRCSKGKIVEKKGSWGTFFACNNFPACKTIYVKDNKDNFLIK